MRLVRWFLRVVGLEPHTHVEDVRILLARAEADLANLTRQGESSALLARSALASVRGARALLRS